MIKFTRIGFIIIFLVIISTPFTGQASDKQNKLVKNVTGEKEPQKLAWDYFEAYIAWLEQHFNKGDEAVTAIKPNPNRSLDPNFVTQHFIDSYNKLIQKDKKMTQPGMVGFLDHDPIICAQYFPDNMDRASFILVKNTGTEAVVKADLFGKETKPPLIVKLMKLKEGWRIDAIVCGKDDFDSLFKKMKGWEKQQKNSLILNQ
jgi:hypothetical protein